MAQWLTKEPVHIAYELMLQGLTTGTYTPIGTHLRSEAVIAALAKLPHGKAPESIRIHIPRALRVVYDIRNKRDVAHLADGIDPNVQDASLVVAVLDWVMAEFVRLYHGVPADEAQRVIDELVTRQAPVVQDFNGFLKVLNTKLKVSPRILLLLYQRGAQGATFEEVSSWLDPKMRKNLKRTLNQLEHAHAQIHSAGDRYRITNTGVREVEQRKWHQPIM